MLQEVVHLPGPFNLISQFQINNKDVKVELVNHNDLNLYNCHGMFIATPPHVDGQLHVDRAPESTEYTDIDDCCLLALKTTAQASRHDAAKHMFWPRHLAHLGLRAWRYCRRSLMLRE